LQAFDRVNALIFQAYHEVNPIFKDLVTLRFAAYRQSPFHSRAPDDRQGRIPSAFPDIHSRQAGGFMPLLIPDWHE
jgi:hypothetical protein